MDNTIILQGRFTSDGNNKLITLRSDCDWMMVYDTTVAAANQVAAVGVKYYWQRGFAADSAWITYKSNAANAANLEAIVTTNGFTLLDRSANPNGNFNAVGSANGGTAISNAAIPVCTNAGANGLIAGQVVRLANITAAPQFAGIDFTVGNNTLTGTTFSLDYAPQLAVAGTTFGWRVINFNPLFYPRRRFITKITQAAQAVVTLSVTHQYQIGQAVRMVVPAGYGMTQMNGLLGTIVAVNRDVDAGNTITLDIDSTAFDAFAFPAAAAVPFTPAECVPVGEDTATALALQEDILSDATENTSSLVMNLAGGASCPGGANGDVMYWVAGKSFSVDNE